MDRSFNVTSSSETVILASVKAHLNVDVSDDDSYISGLITAARATAEAWTHLDLVPKTVVMYLNDFPGSDTPVEFIDHTPVRSISSVVYLDTDGTTQALSTGDYNVDIYSDRPSIYPDQSTSWPGVYSYLNAPDNVRISYASGYTTATLPPQAMQAQYIMIADWYENRESNITGTVVSDAMIPFAAKALLDSIAVVR